MSQVEIMNKVGDRVFLNPYPLYSYEELALKSLGSNTYRGFHKINKKMGGAKSVFTRVLIEEKENIIKGIKLAETVKCIDQFSGEVCSIISDELKKNIKGHQLESYNKIRKPVDIVIEHMTAMYEGFEDVRERNTKFLFLPLDSWMFKSEFCLARKKQKN
ncbi:hypothetical protein OR573_04850 [Halomonas sp. CH40]